MRFETGSRQLEQDIGEGDLTMGAVVEQPYAAAQHNRKYYKHPRGGMPGYLEIPFMAQLPEMMERIATYVITPEGSKLLGAAIEVSEIFDDIVMRNAPLRDDILKESTYSYVLDNGRFLYASSPRRPRRFDKE